MGFAYLDIQNDLFHTLHNNLDFLKGQRSPNVSELTCLNKYIKEQKPSFSSFVIQKEQKPC